MKKYLDKGVIIVNYEEEPDTIPPPAIIIFPMNPNSIKNREPVGGWKHQIMSDCNNMSGDDLIQCLEAASFSADDTIVYTSTDGGNTYLEYDDWFEVNRFFINYWDGIIQYVDIINETVIREAFNKHFTQKNCFYTILSFNLYAKKLGQCSFFFTNRQEG